LEKDSKIIFVKERRTYGKGPKRESGEKMEEISRDAGIYG
jgi:hypothetical protein